MLALPLVGGGRIVHTDVASEAMQRTHQTRFSRNASQMMQSFSLVMALLLRDIA